MRRDLLEDAALELHGERLSDGWGISPHSPRQGLLRVLHARCFLSGWSLVLLLGFEHSVDSWWWPASGGVACDGGAVSMGGCRFARVGERRPDLQPVKRLLLLGVVFYNGR